MPPQSHVHCPRTYQISEPSLVIPFSQSHHCQPVSSINWLPERLHSHSLHKDAYLMSQSQHRWDEWLTLFSTGYSSPASAPTAQGLSPGWDSGPLCSWTLSVPLHRNAPLSSGRPCTPLSRGVMIWPSLLWARCTSQGPITHSSPGIWLPAAGAHWHF